MTDHQDIPELLEQYMAGAGPAGCWVTVREIRARFDLNESAGPPLAGFLQKIHQGPFFTFRYKVTRIERFRDSVPPYRIIRRYLVQERPALRRPQGTPGQERLQKNR